MILFGNALYGMQFEDWVIVLITAVCVAYLLAVFVGGILEWWRGK